MRQRLLVVGGSRGIGAAACEFLIEHGYDVFSVSRTLSRHGQWIQADVTTDEGIDRVVEAVGESAVDALLYLGGAWEKGAFTRDYGFTTSSREDARSVLAVNLLAPILLTQALLPVLLKADNPRVILMGSTSGLDGQASPEVAYTASKFGLRGAAQALRVSLPAVGVTVLNPGNVATPEVELDIVEGRFEDQVPIPLGDVMATLKFVLSVSVNTTLDEINLTQRFL